MAILKARLNDEIHRSLVLEAAYNEAAAENVQLKKVILNNAKKESSSPTPQPPGK